MQASIISIAVNVSFYLFYSAYSKGLKKLHWPLLTEIFFVTKSWEHTLDQINKVVSLAALSIVSIAFLPGLSSSLRYDLLVQGMLHVLLHTAYSSYRYYGTPNIPGITKYHKLFVQIFGDPKKRGKAIKKISVLLGLVGEFAVLATVFGYLAVFQTACLLCVGVSLAHFYLMELDIKLVLQVRPWALLVFPLAFVALGYGLIRE